jgi:drug/metabolite transporter (DMT)-like permease
MVTSLIWGSTWFVIRDQLGTVPTTWSVTYRFIVAAIGMFILALVLRQPLKIDRPMVGWTMLLGLLQFGINFNFVYTAEHYVPSGLVAVVFALLIVPNALLAKYWLGRPISGAFKLGSLIASLGVGLLMLQEYRAAPVGGADVLLGLSLVLCAVATASVSNVLQVTPRIARFPTITILAWSMLWGSIGLRHGWSADCRHASWLSCRRPVSEYHWNRRNLPALFPPDPRHRSWQGSLYGRCHSRGRDAALDDIRRLCLVNAGAGGQRVGDAWSNRRDAGA